MSTPINGPWMRTCTAAPEVYIVSDADRQMICTVKGYERANLAAAAFDLLKALEMLRDFGCPVCSGDCGSANPPVANCPMQEVCAAIAKATGK